MNRLFATISPLLTLGVAGGTGQTADTRAASNAQQFLAAHFQLGSNDFRDLERRRPVTRTLSTVDGREVAVLGVVRIGAPATFYLELLRDIVGFKRAGAAVLQIGAFSHTARIEDVAGLSLDERDLESLQRCRPRDCKMQLSAEALERFRRDIPWGSTDARAAADRLMRRVLSNSSIGTARAATACSWPTSTGPVWTPLVVSLGPEAHDRSVADPLGNGR